ncbi:hypothetical protein LCGC14_1099040 [marine sediment metagenome]|uniref:Terminase large subunit gp17-like C-terminal domain-containing protein n=1 Tax=marine sediment metagenome TaxID=412755 RepID=A0A0F9MA59_9ZZZZ
MSLRPRLNEYIPHAPTPKQAASLLFEGKEMLFGGAAGGGKTDWILMAALQYMDVPGYSALLLRRTFPMLIKSDSLIPRSHEWLTGRARWNEDKKTWTFPSGARLEFGHMQYENDKNAFQAAAYQFIGLDELTQFSRTMYTYMFSRCRRPKDPRVELSRVPLRMRATSNPGGKGHNWVKMRFVEPGSCDGVKRVFIPSLISDNPYLDQEEYEEMLSELDPLERKQLMEGDWSSTISGGIIRREWFGRPMPILAAPRIRQVCRWWDLAATAEEDSLEDDNDYSVGSKVGMVDGYMYIMDVKRGRWSPMDTDRRIRNAADVVDGLGVVQGFDQDPGSAGKRDAGRFQRMLPRHKVVTERPTGDKLVRGRGFASACEAGNVFLIEGGWNEEFLAEMEAIGSDTDHDDQWDATVGAYNYLTGEVCPAAEIF